MSRNHDLIKHASSHFECRVCEQQWPRRPTSQCPGLKLYPRYDHSPLLTQTQLGYMGYQNSRAALPPAVGCYYAQGRGRKAYILLYDPSQAIKKTNTRKRQATHVVTELFWPLRSLGLLEMCQALKTYQHYSRSEELNYNRCLHEIAQIAVCLPAFSRDEIEQYSGGVIELKISPFLMRCSYPFPLPDQDEDPLMGLVSAILEAYRKYRADEASSASMG